MTNSVACNLHTQLLQDGNRDIGPILRKLDREDLSALFDHVSGLISDAEEESPNEHVLLDDPWQHDEYPFNISVRNQAAAILGISL